MRADSFGLWWADEPVIKEKGKRADIVRPTPPIPDTGWRPPELSVFANVVHRVINGQAKVISLDTETKDTFLLTEGPGWGRGKGHIAGVSVYILFKDNSVYKCYLPFRHEIQPEFNLDFDQVKPLLVSLFDTPNVPKVGANLVYDVGWLAEEGIRVTGKLYDVLYAEAILFDTAKSYSLNSVASRWLGEQKEETALYEWAARAYGGKVERKQAGNIYRCPPALVGPYAEVDAELPANILQRQWVALERVGLLEIFQLECDLIPVLIGMRYRGIRVNLEAAESAKVYLQEKEDTAQQQLNQAAGFEVECYAAASLQRLFDAKNLKYPRTTKGAPSFTKEFLTQHESPVAKLVNQVRKYNKARATFIENSILNKVVGDRIHPSFHPLRGEEGGAVSGRFSSSHPNAQQWPARDKEIGPLIRNCFIPDEGYPYWIKQDLSQIEYRCFAHYSGDQRLISAYQDPNTDYHNVVSSFLGHMMPRGTIKNFNFMSLYGGGKGKVITMLKAEFSKAQVEELLIKLLGEIPPGDMYSKLADTFITMYDTNFPAASESLQRDLEYAERTGEIRTILHRRSTFDLWEPIGYQKQKPLPYDAARQAYGNSIKRAYCFRALNRKLQGSSADLLKKGMLDAYNEGLYNKIGFPTITVHDELDNSYHPDLKHEFYRLQRCVETAIPMRVPIIMEAELGRTWNVDTDIDLSK